MESAEIREFYDKFVSLQKVTGTNKRHHKILELAERHGLTRAAKVLEIGCGIGTFTGLMARRMKGELLALDISPASIDVARSHLKDLPKVHVKVADVIHEDLEGKFNAIILPDVLEHIPFDQQPLLFRKLKELLDVDGKILIHSPDPFFLEWVRVNQPEVLQVVDLPLYLPRLATDLHAAGLTIDHFQRHCIWRQAPDYMAMIISHVPVDEAYPDIIHRPKGIRGILHTLRTFLFK